MCTLLYVINYMYMLCSSWCSGWVFASGMILDQLLKLHSSAKLRKSSGSVCTNVSLVTCHKKQVGLHVTVSMYISEVLYYKRGRLSAKLPQAFSCFRNLRQG